IRKLERIHLIVRVCMPVGVAAPGKSIVGTAIDCGGHLRLMVAMIDEARTAPIEISVVIPVYNEGDNLEPLMRELREAFAGRLAAEVILVDDGSIDDTAVRFATLRGAHRLSLRLIRHVDNRGQSAAILTGVTSAAADIVATLDGDGQNDPADIPILLDAYRRAFARGVRLVAGQRIRRRDTWMRRVSSRLANFVRSLVLHDHIADTGCGLKVFDRVTFLRIAPFDHMHRFLPALFLGYGAGVHTVPVHHRPRRHGYSKYGVRNRLWVGIVDLFGVKWLMRRAIASMPLATDERT
ncbi:MAG: glycosyltransferase family 2 protein, partial [Woeseiaceae bacterium]